jgi:LysR family transcriptional regulator, glycine cleavage system transcriptional activator
MTQRLPSLNALRAFEAAGRHLSFTKAAEELHVTPAAVGHQIKMLEEDLGVRLFRRLTRAIALTETGQILLPGIRDGFDRFENALERLRGQEESGVLNVGVPLSLSAKWLVHRLERFHQAYPDIDLRIAASIGIVDFARDDIDLTIRYGRGDYPGLRVELLMREELFPVCSPKFLEGPHPIKTPDDLRHHTLLHDDSFKQPYHEQFIKTFHGSFPNWHTWLEAAGAEDVDPTQGLRLSPPLVVIQAAIEGHGVALGRGALVNADLAAGLLVKPFELTLPLNFGYYFVCPEATTDQPKIAAFRTWIMEEAKSHQAPTLSAAQ